jgi:hypothetical protein
MKALAALLALAALAAGPVAAASVEADDARTGVPLSVAKRLGGVAPSAIPGQTRLSGVPTRQATVGLGAQRLAPEDSVASVVKLSGVPLARAKRL